MIKNKVLIVSDGSDVQYIGCTRGDDEKLGFRTLCNHGLRSSDVEDVPEEMIDD